MRLGARLGEARGMPGGGSRPTGEVLNAESTAAPADTLDWNCSIRRAGLLYSCWCQAASEPAGVMRVAGWKNSARGRASSQLTPGLEAALRCCKAALRVGAASAIGEPLLVHDTTAHLWLGLPGDCTGDCSGEPMPGSLRGEAFCSSSERSRAV